MQPVSAPPAHVFSQILRRSILHCESRPRSLDPSRIVSAAPPPKQIKPPSVAAAIRLHGSFFLCRDLYLHAHLHPRPDQQRTFVSNVAACYYLLSSNPSICYTRQIDLQPGLICTATQSYLSLFPVTSQVSAHIPSPSL